MVFAKASSAYKIIRVFLTAFGRLLIYTLNSKGPKMLPCGTPSVMACGSDNSPFIITLCCLSVRYDLNHLKDLSDSYPGKGKTTLRTGLRSDRSPPLNQK